MAPCLPRGDRKEKLMKEKVLLVDDDDKVLAALKRQLRRQFNIETALSAEEALKKITEDGPYAVVVSDFLMPGMNGIEFLSQVKNTSPDTVRMMLTGSADMSTAIQAVNEGNIYKFHPKPCPAETLGETIQSGMEEYRKITADQSQMKKVQSSLAQASKIQQQLVPKFAPRVDGFDIAGKSIWCDETSGDYYDFIHPDEWKREKIGVVVADVIGHGISAALLMISVRAFLKERILSPGSGSAIVCDVNKRLVRDIEKLNLFVTMFYSEIDLQEKCFRWVHAGHESALFYDPALDTFEALGGEGVPLGVMEDWAYTQAEKPIRSGQIIAIATDGIKEAVNRRFELFGNDRLMAVIRENTDQSAEQIVAAVFDALEQFRHPAERKDDETLVIIKVL
jgi:sigma-B regulation protein RsbU (phosphoserine phosphatase)